MVRGKRTTVTMVEYSSMVTLSTARSRLYGTDLPPLQRFPYQGPNICMRVT
jgi:hypothetical protein